MDIKRVIGAGAIAIGLVAILSFSWVWFAPCALGGCAPLDDLAEYQAEGSELVDINGDAFARLATVNRTIISLDDLPPHVPQAVLAIEDRRFYDHSGIDFRRTVGALLANLRSGEVSEGGSTITQQLARNLFPEWLPYQERSLRRKVMEARVARQLERTFSKDKILELYLNHIYLGSGAYGIEAAARTYFGKPAAELTLMEAATLAGLPQAPSQINPRQNLERATERRNLVLDEMVEAGFLDVGAAQSAKDEAIAVTGDTDQQNGPRSSYFVELVRRELQERVGSRFYTAGLKIFTTLDPTAQSAAEEALSQQLTAIENGAFGVYRHPTYSAANGEAIKTDYLQGAVVVMDANNGEVRALVGGRDFSQSKFDRATQALRQPGSAFKPFIYAAALERYGSPTHQVEDSPLRLTLSNGQVWAPENYSRQYDGAMTMRDALVQSKNVATVRLAQEVGVGSAIRIARSLGISSDIPDYPSTALGAAEVRPIELIAAYAAFANGGQRVEPHLVRRVEDRNGRVLWEARPRSERVLDPAVAFVLTTMLQDVVDRGTGTAVRSVGFRAPAAGKTGTTNDGTDAWFVGYTPELVGGVWIGLDDPQPIISGATGGSLAAPVWGRMMNSIYATRPAPSGWRAPGGVRTAEVDRSTGAALSESCPSVVQTYTEYFIRSSPPRQTCPDYERDSRYTLGDSIWVNGEWREYDFDPDLDYERYEDGDDFDRANGRSGVDWPELEELRRQMENRGDDRRFPSDDPRQGPSVEDGELQPDRGLPRGLPRGPTSPPGEPRGAADADLPSAPPPADPEPREQPGNTGVPNPEDQSEEEPSDEDDGPDLLGVPASDPGRR
ncbi:MAG: PBP1A family penicillin-binding protein [Gemmatimonadota bacterium]